MFDRKHLVCVCLSVVSVAGLRLHSPKFQRRVVSVRATDSDWKPESVRWYSADSVILEDAGVLDGTVLPLLPRENVVLLPGSEHLLDMSEPRSRKLYSDLAASGKREFATTFAAADGSFAEVASVLQLDEPADSTKAAAQETLSISCTVVWRLAINRVLMPRSWMSDNGGSDDSYLKAELTEVPERWAAASNGDDEAYSHILKSLCADVLEVVALQEAEQEDPRASFDGLRADAFARGPQGDANLWSLAAAWQSLAAARVQQSVNECDAASEAAVERYFAARPQERAASGSSGKIPIPPALRDELKALQSSAGRAIMARIEAATIPYQLLLQATDQADRARIIQAAVSVEKARLLARKEA